MHLVSGSDIHPLDQSADDQVLGADVRFIKALRPKELPSIFRLIPGVIIYDGRYQVVADEGENGFTAEKGETFLQSVYTTVITPTP